MVSRVPHRGLGLARARHAREPMNAAVYARQSGNCRKRASRSSAAEKKDDCMLCKQTKKKPTIAANQFIHNSAADHGVRSIRLISRSSTQAPTKLQRASSTDSERASIIPSSVSVVDCFFFLLPPPKKKISQEQTKHCSAANQPINQSTNQPTKNNQEASAASDCSQRTTVYYCSWQPTNRQPASQPASQRSIYLPRASKLLVRSQPASQPSLY